MTANLPCWASICGMALQPFETQKNPDQGYLVGDFLNNKFKSSKGSEMELAFNYTSAAGLTKNYKMVWFNEQPYHFAGVAVNDDGEISYKNFLKSSVNHYINNSDQLLNSPFAISPPPKQIKAQRSSLTEVLFTGFSSVDKALLIEKAKNANPPMYVPSRVTLNLAYLVCGATAGKVKVMKAINQGVVILSDTDFLQLLETGEIPLC
jgi:hypothetical protein